MMKRTLILLAVAMLTLSACAPGGAPTSAPTAAARLPIDTPAPTATPTHTPSSTATPTPIPTLPPEQLGGLSGVPDPRSSNPELFDLTDPDAPIPQFVNAMRMAGIEVAPEQVVEGLGFEVVTGADGKEYVVGSYTTTDAQGIPYSLTIKAEKDEKDTWTWKNLYPIDLEQAIPTDFGVYLTMYDYNHRYLGRFAEVIFPDGPFSRRWIEEHGTADAYRAINIVAKNGAILYLHPGLWHLDIDQKAQTLSGREDTLQYIREIADFYLTIAGQFHEKTSKSIYINFINEPWWADPPNNPVNVGWLQNPYYENLGKDYVEEAYIAFYESALEKGLKPGDNVRFAISVDGIFFPNRKLDFAVINFEEIRQTIASRMGIPAENVQLDLAIQWRFDSKVTSPRTSSEGRYKIPTEQEISGALDKLNNHHISFHITEFEIANVSDPDFIRFIRTFTTLAVKKGAISITYGGLSSTSRNPFYAINHPLYENDSPTDIYYGFLSMLMEIATKSRKR